MNACGAILLFSSLFILSAVRNDELVVPDNAPATVESVDLERYQGLWYELARLPVIFQRDRDRSTAEYELMDDGSVSIINTSISPRGRTRSVTGSAVPVEGTNNTRLKVNIDNFFARTFGSSPEFGNYWILKLEPDYSLALVGSPDRNTLWLLSREPSIPQEKFEQYIDAAEAAGYDTDDLIINNG